MFREMQPAGGSIAWTAVPPADASGVALPETFATTPLATQLADALVRFADRTAVLDPAGAVSFGELDRRARAYAAAIAAVAAEQATVAVVTRRGAEGIAAILGCVMARRICIILDAAQPQERLAAILADARPTVAVGADHLLPAGCLALAMPDRNGGTVATLPAPASPDEAAFVVYTSGSTGLPKGIAAGSRALLTRARHVIDPAGLNADDCLLATTHPAAMSGLAFMFAALLVGARQCAFDLKAEGATAMAALLARERVSVMISPPPLVRTLLAQAGSAAALRSLRVLRCGADVFPRADLVALRALLPAGCRIGSTYASSEGMMIAHWFIPSDFDDGAPLLPSGHLLADHDYALLDADGGSLPVEPGQAGELVLRGAHLALGEWREGRLVPGRLAEDPARPGQRIFRTGDLVRIGADGLLRVDGRADRQVKINGMRIELAEIEVAMRAAPDVADAAVIATPDGTGWRLQGFVVPTDDQPAELLAQATRGRLARMLPAAMVPSRIVVIAAIPRLPIGKVDQQRLLESMPTEPSDIPAPAGTTAGNVVTGAVRDDVREAVDRAWARTLDRQSLADDVPFDEAGGDSLRFLILVYHMEETLGTALPLDLFDLAMTPSAVAAAVQRHLDHSADIVAASAVVPEVFLLPGIGGDEPRLVRFREACAASCRIVPVDYGDWHDWVRPDFDLNALLERLAADITSRAPDRPLVLAGYSLGGFLAYAVAARLAAAGREVRAIGLLDASNLGAARAAAALAAGKPLTRQDELHQIVSGFQAGLPGNALARSVVRRLTSPRWAPLLPMATRLSSARLPWDFGYYLRGHLRIGLLSKFIEGYRANFAPDPALATVPLVLLRSGRADETIGPDDDLGWAGYGGSVAVFPVPGDHFSMFDPPNVHVVADRFVTAMRPHVGA